MRIKVIIFESTLFGIAYKKCDYFGPNKNIKSAIRQKAVNSIKSMNFIFSIF
jgi:hypothetical protein